MKELTHVDTDLDLPMGPGFIDPRENSYCWHIAEGRLPELIQDPKDHPFTQTMAITEFLPVGCHLNTPLRLSDGTIYGSFCCLSRQPDRTMTERDVSVLRAFATLAAERIEQTLETDHRHDLLEAAVGAVIEAGDIRIFHQPIVDLEKGVQVGVECLARFSDASLRPPNLWFEEATQIGRGVELEVLAIKGALATLGSLQAGHYLSVNASPATIVSGELAPILNGLDRRRIVLEVTEHEEIEDFAKLKQALEKLSPHVRIAIDDVGAGYAGLRHLVELGPDLLKLDMMLTRDIQQDPARRALATAMVHFADDMGCKLVAEGIETKEEHAVLAELGVDYGQGYLFGRPLPA
jgi:EAL domain-containing protein (putative c-di-GMP-specific phosphodiesterase class I)